MFNYNILIFSLETHNEALWKWNCYNSSGHYSHYNSPHWRLHLANSGLHFWQLQGKHIPYEYGSTVYRHIVLYWNSFMWGEGSLVQALFFRTLLIKDFSCGLFLSHRLMKALTSFWTLLQHLPKNLSIKFFFRVVMTMNEWDERGEAGLCTLLA